MRSSPLTPAQETRCREIAREEIAAWAARANRSAEVSAEWRAYRARLRFAAEMEARSDRLQAKLSRAARGGAGA